MGEANTLALWVKANHAKLDLKLSKLGWIDHYLPGHFDILASITVDGVKAEGRGSSNLSVENAVEKAITEAIERAVFTGIDKSSWNESLEINSSVAEDFTTSGFALHVDEERAILGASLELIERDLFFCHYLTTTPFFEVSEWGREKPQENSIFKTVQEKVALQGVELKLGELIVSPHVACYICVAFGENFSRVPFGAIIGMGCASSREQAINKAVMECLPNLHAHLAGTESAVLTADEFIKKDKHDPLDHLLIAKNLDNVAYLRFLFGKERRAVGVEENFDNMIVKSVPLPNWCDGSGLVAMRAYNPKMQNIFFGQTTKEKINWERLTKFCGRDISFEDIHHYQHPFP